MSPRIESRTTADGELLGVVEATAPKRLGGIVERAHRAQVGCRQAGSGH